MTSTDAAEEMEEVQADIRKREDEVSWGDFDYQFNLNFFINRSVTKWLNIKQIIISVAFNLRMNVTIKIDD